MQRTIGMVAVAAITVGAGGVEIGCSDDETQDIIDTRVSTTADFTSFHTFAFTGPSDMSPGSTLEIPGEVAVNLSAVNDAMREELTALGLREVQPWESPDLRAFSLASTENEESVYWSCVDSYWYGYWYWDWQPCDWVAPVYEEYTAGTIVLGLVDPAANELVFGGLIEGVADDADDFADRIDEDVDEVFDDYPRNRAGELPPIP